MKNLNQWFEKGISKYQYIHEMKTHKENLLTIYNKFRLDDEDRSFLQTVQEKKLRAIVLSEDWCGDAMVNLPIFLRIAEESLMETRLLYRDMNLELMDQYLTNGKSRSIPIIIIIDEAGEEVAKWGPRAPKVQELVEKMKSSLPDKDSSEYEQAFKSFISEVTEQFLTNESIWEEVKKDLIQTIRRISK
ncbi:thioredoxin family protein [Bacillus sp. FJAT-47783]|uniref:thioredoxin family protein n=1 Tax=Bacillus sp. FJAT-47783 TaxID=2922712 RepID=UPI001FABAF55|nr:thioredoxin family protein [Bacillus sp. FJAT-47783]